MSETIASLAIFIFWTEPRICMLLFYQIHNLKAVIRETRYDEGEEAKTYVSASTILVLLAFSMVNFTLPPSPAIRPKKRFSSESYTIDM